jgi:hypothetical protein
MAFIKTTLDPINTRAADATFDFEEPYIQTGIISGQSYTSAQVGGGIPKPSYLQIAANSAVVTVVGSQTEPLRLVFPLGLHNANTGGEIGAWRSFTSKTVANNTVTVSVSEKAWVYAEINENGEPNNTNAWTIDYGHEIGVGKTYTGSQTEPTSPIDGDVWFDITNNKLFKYNNSLAQWEWKKRVYLGEAGVGDNGYIYTISSWFPNREYANYQDSFYPVYYENPYRLFDGVSFTTNGLYTAAEAANWANNYTIAEGAAGNQIAMNAIANSATALAETKIAANSINAFGNSALALTSLGANSTFVDGFANSDIVGPALANNSTSVAVFANNATWMNSIANSTTFMVEVANSTIAMSAIANSAIAQGAILSGTQNTTFLTTIANNASVLSALSGGSVGNILFTLIGTNSSYQTLVANAQGQLISLANSASGPILALGGNTVAEITDGGVDYRVHTFTGLGTLNVRSVGEQPNVEYLVVAGGASGGHGGPGNGGGGGAGGYRTNVPGQLSGGSPGTAEPALSVTQSISYTITVGGGGASKGSPGSGNIGSNSVFSTITSDGGGGGGAYTGGGLSGGSGGGSGQSSAGPVVPGGTATANQGFDGGDASGAGPGNNSGCGGGGAGEAGEDSGVGSGIAGSGGNGIISSITGSNVIRGGGGGGSGHLPNTDRGLGGNGGGGDGQNERNPAFPAVAGSANLGGGGGGHGEVSGSGAAGGSGIVIVRYPIQKV